MQNIATTTQKYILALDQGTTSSRALIFDAQGQIVGIAQQNFTQIFPQPGWVEHDPHEIWQTQLTVAQNVLQQTGIKPTQIAAIGITNQRETTLIWDAHTGQPLYNAIVWQDKRTTPLCEQLVTNGLTEYIRQETGLIPDAYFSGTKLAWLLQHIPEAQAKAESGAIKFGTVDTWLLWNLTKGKIHATDVSNASRTMLYNIRKMEWDETMLRALQIPETILPQVFPSSSATRYGSTHPSWFGGVSLPIMGIAGDQQAALFGQQCYQSGMAKNTYGTGCFMLLNTGTQLVTSQQGLLTTVAWQISNAPPQYALEGSVFVAGAAVQWLRDGLGLINHAAETEFYANQVPDTLGVYVVPASAGLGAPHWTMYARGAMFGLTRGTTKAHIIRATLESIAYQTRDVLEAMQADAKITLEALRVDGGATANNFLMQFQADILGVPVLRPAVIEATAFGAALLAGYALGNFFETNTFETNQQLQIFYPRMPNEQKTQLYEGWQKAIKQCVF
ncbi:MAG TPA: glycerol kinase GlpK [Chitinophagales bacterium]|nr:glycerol kinase GlpK [Chitinophagales bacterium]